MYIVTVDNGTSSTKTALWTAEGVPVAHAEQAYALHRPHPLWAEIDGNVWWDAVCSTIQQVMSESGVDPKQVAGVGVDGIGWTLLPVDGECNPLSPAMIWLDRRAEEEARWLRNLAQANDLVNLAANPLDSGYITPKILWLKKHRPDVFAAVHKFLTASGFIVARLTGEFTCDYTQAYGYHFFDLRHERWDPAAAQLLGVPLEKLPALKACTDIAGSITAQAAAQTGLVAGTPVITGCLDAAAGALGAGVTRPGQTLDQGGQAGGMALSVTQVTIDPRLIFSHHVLPGQYLLQSGTVGGGSLAWFRDLLWHSSDGGNPFELFSAEVARTEPGAGGLVFIPYMAGERTPIWSSTARGVFFGLSYSTTRGDMLRAIMEGCAFAVYDNLKVAEQMGATVVEWLGSGGATRSAEWCRIKADVTAKPFVVARRADGHEGGHTLGLFAMTARAIGFESDIGACVERLLPQRQVFYPRPEQHALYEQLFGVYMSVSRKLMPDFDRLASITREQTAAGTKLPV
ncbi:MAG: FGGY family carbohydrate kinase [Chloroflexota bacterium]